jgi:hypothetical protein
MIMRPDWSAFKARVSNRLSRLLCVAPFRLRNKGPMVSFTFGALEKCSLASVSPSRLTEICASMS